MRNLSVGLVQQTCTADRNTNIDHSISRIRSLAESGVDLVILQELHSHLYFCQTEDTRHFDLAETIPGPTTDLFSALARELGLVIVLSLFERRAAGLYHNSAVVLDKDGSLAGTYRKMHIPDDPGYYEKFYFTPGDLGFEPIQTSIGRLGVLVCWDQWYPEAARMMALAGAEVLIYPTAIGYDPNDTAEEKDRQREAWVTIQRSHAIANALPVISVNRVGFETDPSGHSKGIQFWGNSFVCGSQGEMIVAGNEEEAILTATLDLDSTDRTRRIWPFFRDRRIDSYHDLLKRYRDKP